MQEQRTVEGLTLVGGDGGRELGTDRGRCGGGASDGGKRDAADDGWHGGWCGGGALDGGRQTAALLWWSAGVEIFGSLTSSERMNGRQDLVKFSFERLGTYIGVAFLQAVDNEPRL